ncbi:Vacuolar protein-sorting-associated protein 33-like protein [Dichanthelium oligosanthes]|uniref:Vacuolar protein-sorting-associated protein 33-like protein n=1 Tax=Dichanthelium oligosanthes TaxID=888268 RepID=A0A1E5UTG7_9POAL|nr:Vacuolar protein-sorting-associated protein 33-like protein [Dichanthelium oligosanthes]
MEPQWRVALLSSPVAAASSAPLAALRQCPLPQPSTAWPPPPRCETPARRCLTRPICSSISSPVVRLCLRWSGAAEIHPDLDRFLSNSLTPGQMAQIPNLDNAPINLAALREQSQKDLLGILKSIRGKKCLVIDPKLAGTLSLIIQTSLLKEYGAELRILSSDPLQTECTKIIYLVRSELSFMKFIASQIKTDEPKGLQREYFLYFVPRRTVACEKILEEEKVHQKLTLGEYPLYLVPLDDDVLSFELDHSLQECLIEGDTSSIWHVAKAIHKLEFAFGVIPNVRAKGLASTKAAELLNSMQLEDPVNMDDMGIQEINTVILLDREVDMVTPMCSQLTYEGLLDEMLQIHNGSVEVDASIMGTQQDGKKVLRQKATSIQQDYVEVKSTNTQSVSELKDFVRRLHSLPEIAYIEEMIHKQEPIENVLRLLVLLSLTNAGLPKKNFDYLRREILHSYGFEHMNLLYNLEKAGLFKRQESRSNWVGITKALHLIVDVNDTANPSDISYIFSGYAPLSIRLVQHASAEKGLFNFILKKCFVTFHYPRSIEELLKLLPGPHLDLKRGGLTINSSLEVHPGSGVQQSIDRVGHRTLVLIVFIGGVTFAEIAALRFLSAQEGMGYDFLVATTKVVNGNTILKPIISNSKEGMM